MNLRLWIIASLVIFATSYVHAGDVVKVIGEADYFSPATETPRQARESGIREAQLEALKQKFGLVLGEHTVTKNSSSGGVTINMAQSLGESDVNGEWIRDLKEPIVEIINSTPQGTTYHVKVQGEAREIPQNRIAFNYSLLFNGIDTERNKLRGGEFHYGDECYVYLRTPIDGFAAIFLADDDDEGTMQCLLPYDGDNRAAYPVKANKDYIFFSKQAAEPDCLHLTTRMIMESRKNVDCNVFYIMFSPNDFTALGYRSYSEVNHGDYDQIKAELMPRETTFNAFHKWLGKSRRKDPDLQVVKLPVTISK